MADERPLVLTVREAADYLQVSEATLRRAIRQGRLPVVRLGPRTSRIPVRFLQEWVEREAKEVCK